MRTIKTEKKATKKAAAAKAVAKRKAAAPKAKLAPKSKRADRRIKFVRAPREDEHATPQEKAIMTAIQTRGTCTEAELVEDLVRANFPTRSTPAVIYRYYKLRTLLANGWIAKA